LTAGVLAGALADAVTLGYESVSISGGEPLLYAALPEVLAHARKLGMSTSVTTNGTLLTPRRLDPLVGLIDVLAISIDGPPDLHDDIRARPGAFDQLLRGLDEVRSRNITFGFIHTLTQTSWEHLVWLAELTAEHGGKLMQVHPCEAVGRAQSEMKGRYPDEKTLARAYLLLQVLAVTHREQFRVQFDVLHPMQIMADGSLVMAADLPADLADAVPGELVSPLVIEADGVVVPVCYGFPRRFEVASLHRERLSRAWPRFLTDTFGSFHRLCSSVRDDILASGSEDLFSWYDRIVQASHQATFTAHRFEGVVHKNI